MAAVRFVLDLSRLLSRVRHTAPTGVDRVEFEYARRLPGLLGSDLGYAVRHPAGAIGMLSDADAQRLLERTEARWQGQAPAGTGSALRTLLAVRPHAPDHGSLRALILASPSNLDRPGTMKTMRQRLNARLVALVHDLIPLTHPEYARPGGARRHARRLETLRTQAECLLTNSAATAEALGGYWGRLQHPRITASHLGLSPLAPAEPEVRSRPYFLAVGTIEPRKNHLLLLHIWRRFAKTLRPDEVPELVLTGRRGWENEQVLDLLDRAPAMRAHVTELGAVSERRLSALMRGTRALLMPSFAEGYGLPVAEALSVGTPVIASDLPAHREVGGEAPDLFDPLDGMGWMGAVTDHAERGPMQRAQEMRLAAWQAPSWEAHLDMVAAQAEKALS